VKSSSFSGSWEQELQTPLQTVETVWSRCDFARTYIGLHSTDHRDLMHFAPSRRTKTETVQLLATCLFTFYPALTLAQAPSTSAPPSREGSVEFAFIGTAGNASTQTIGLAGEVILRPGPWVIHSRGGFNRNKSETTLTAESVQYLIRTDRELDTRSGVFAEYAFFRDEFAGIEHRSGVVGGVAYKLVDRDAHVLSLDGGLGYLNEHRLTDPDISTATFEAGVKYYLWISPNAELTEDVRFTGVFDQPNDWRAVNVVAISARLNSLFSLKASNTIRYTNAPLAPFKRTDLNTAIALVAKF
jgi:putative salt-induced outer membrane protein YdiY